MTTRGNMLALICFIRLAQLHAVAYSDDPDDHTIATVNGAPIKFKFVRVSLEQAENWFVKGNGRKPSANDAKALESLLHDLETKALLKAMRLAVRDSEIKRLNIEVSVAEVDERWQEMAGKKDIKTAIDAGRETMAILVDALNAACNGEEDSNEAFRTRLDGRMSKVQWEGHLKYDCTPERRRILAEQARAAGPQIDDYRKLIKDQILDYRLRVAIDDALTQEDSEYAEYRRLLRDSPNDPKILTKSPMYGEAKRQEWWQKRFQEAKVEILDPRFESVLESWMDD